MTKSESFSIYLTLSCCFLSSGFWVWTGLHFKAGWALGCVSVCHQQVRLIYKSRDALPRGSTDLFDVWRVTSRAVQHLPFSADGCDLFNANAYLVKHSKTASCRMQSVFAVMSGWTEINLLIHYCSITLVCRCPFFLDINVMMVTVQSRFQCTYPQQHDTSSHYVFHTANGIRSHDNPLGRWRRCQSDITLAAGISTVLTGTRKTWKLAGFQRTEGNESSTSSFWHVVTLVHC